MSKIAWITGGSRGIGFATAEALAAEGYQIAISARNVPELDRARAELAAVGHSVHAARCDVADEGSVHGAYRSIADSLGAPSLLVNCAGISPWSTFTECATEEFDAVIATNLRGLFLTTKIALPAMYQAKAGAIVNVLSVASTKAYKNGAAYVASKFGGLGFANAVREESRKHGVRVISVMPGAVETELWGQEERAKFHDKMMQPVDIAQTIVHALRLPERALIEDILIRPMVGDL